MRIAAASPIHDVRRSAMPVGRHMRYPPSRRCRSASAIGDTRRPVRYPPVGDTGRPVRCPPAGDSGRTARCPPVGDTGRLVRCPPVGDAGQPAQHPPVDDAIPVGRCDVLRSAGTITGRPARTMSAGQRYRECRGLSCTKESRGLSY